MVGDIMTATANPSYIEPAVSPARASSFFWTMIALAALDVVLLFWIVNPLSARADSLPSPSVTAAKVQVVQALSDKPSAFGSVRGNARTASR